ncbi:hypothetical protein V1509DRAFT_316993 [Lipomyces kononenkoae]
MQTDDFGEEEDYAFLMPSRSFISPPESVGESSDKRSASNHSDRSTETMTTDDEDSYSIISNISNIDEAQFNDSISIFSSTGVRSNASSSSSEAGFEAGYKDNESISELHDSLARQDSPVVPEASGTHLTNASESPEVTDDIFGHFSSDGSRDCRYDVLYDTNDFSESSTAASSTQTDSCQTILAAAAGELKLQTVIVCCIRYINIFFNWISYRYKLLSPSLLLGIPNVIYLSNTDNSDALAKVQPKLTNAYKCAPSVLIPPLTSFILSWLETRGYLPRFISWVPIIRRCEYVSFEQGDRYIAIDTLSDSRNSTLYVAHGDCFSGSRLNRSTCPDLIVVYYDPSGPSGITSRMMENLRRLASVVNVPILILSDSKQQIRNDFDFIAERATIGLRLSKLCRGDDSSLSLSMSDLTEMDDYDIYNALISASRSDTLVDSRSIAKDMLIRISKSCSYERTIWKRLIFGAVIASLSVCLHIFYPSMPYGLQLQQTDFRFHVISKNSILIKAPTVMHQSVSFWPPSVSPVNHDFDVDAVCHAYGECLPNASISKIFGDEAVITLDRKDAWGDINVTISSTAFKKWYIVKLGEQEQEYANNYKHDSILRSPKTWPIAESTDLIRIGSEDLYTHVVKPAAAAISDRSAGGLLRKLGASISEHCSEYSNAIDWAALLKGYQGSLVLLTQSGNQGAIFVKTQYDTAKEFSSNGIVELSHVLSGIADRSRDNGASLWASVYTSWQETKVSVKPTLSSVSEQLRNLNSVYEKYLRCQLAELKSQVPYSASNAHRKLAKTCSKFVEGFKAAREDAMRMHRKNKAIASKNAKKAFKKYVKNKKKSKIV